MNLLCVTDIFNLSSRIRIIGKLSQSRRNLTAESDGSLVRWENGAAACVYLNCGTACLFSIENSDAFLVDDV